MSDKRECKGCVCEELENLSTGARVRVFTLGQDPVATPDAFDILIFSSFDEDTCVAIFTDSTGTMYLICCQDIRAISIVPPTFP